MICTVCKSRDGQSERNGSTERQHFDPNFPDAEEANPIQTAGWISTKDRTSVSQMRVNYKLFDCLKREFKDGNLCTDCTDILEQIDSLQFQANELIKELRDRVDSYYEDEDDTLMLSAKRGFSSTPVARKRMKMEVDDDYGDPIADPDYTPVQVKTERGNQAKKPPRQVIKVENKRCVPYKNEFWEKANDLQYVQSVLRSKNFDYEIQLIGTIQNTEHLIYDGAIWHPATFREFKTDKLLFKWVCGKSHHFSYRCSARVATTADKACVIQESRFTDHNHELDPEEIKLVLLKNRVKEIALNHPEMTPIRVLKTVEMMNEDMEVKPSHASILKYITRIQDKHGIPRKPRERKPGYVPRKRKKPLTKWKKTEVSEGEAVASKTDEKEEEAQAVQHIIIQQTTGDQPVIVQQTNVETSTSEAFTTTTMPQTFQIEYTGHVNK